MSDGGRFNFTNLHIDPENYISSNPHFVKSALSLYTQWDFIALVEKHGIAYHEKTLGQLFCDKSSEQVLEMLLTECEEVGVKILTHCQIGSVEQLSDGYFLQTSLGEFGCHSLVVATGGLSIPTMGATGFGYELAEQFGLDVLDRSALVPFTFSDQWKSLRASRWFID